MPKKCRVAEKKGEGQASLSDGIGRLGPVMTCQFFISVISKTRKLMGKDCLWAYLIEFELVNDLYLQLTKWWWSSYSHVFFYRCHESFLTDDEVPGTDRDRWRWGETNDFSLLLLKKWWWRYGTTKQVTVNGGKLKDYADWCFRRKKEDRHKARILLTCPPPDQPTWRDLSSL